MSGCISERHSGLHARPLPSLLIALIGTLSMTAYGQAISPGAGPASASDSLLAREVVIPISTVRRFFPQVDQEARTGPHLTAVGGPKATRSVIYANSSNSKKVTITVDEYVSSNDASSAYEEAVQKSKAVPGFTPISAPDLGENTVTATVTRGEETHIGFGASHGNLILGITVVGSDPITGRMITLGSLPSQELATV